MKNKLSDLNDHMFAALERLGNESLYGDQLKAEIQRARTVATVGITIVQGARLVLDAEELALEYNITPNGKFGPALLDDKSFGSATGNENG